MSKVNVRVSGFDQIAWAGADTRGIARVMHDALTAMGLCCYVSADAKGALTHPFARYGDVASCERPRLDSGVCTVPNGVVIKRATSLWAALAAADAPVTFEGHGRAVGVSVRRVLDSHGAIWLITNDGATGAHGALACAQAMAAMGVWAPMASRLADDLDSMAQAEMATDNAVDNAVDNATLDTLTSDEAATLAALTSAVNAACDDADKVEAKAKAKGKAKGKGKGKVANG